MKPNPKQDGLSMSDPRWLSGSFTFEPGDWTATEMVAWRATMHPLDLVALARPFSTEPLINGVPCRQYHGEPMLAQKPALAAIDGGAESEPAKPSTQTSHPTAGQPLRKTA